MKFLNFLLLLVIISCNGQGENNKAKVSIVKESTKNNFYKSKCNDTILFTGQKFASGNNWILSSQQVEEILKLSVEIDEDEWHFSYPITPCNIEIKNYSFKGRKYDLQINGGSYISLYDGKKTIILGCDSPQCHKFFLLPKENMKDDEGDSEYNFIDRKYEVDFNKDQLSDLLIIKQNGSEFILKIIDDHKLVLTKKFSCDTFDIDTNVKNKQTFNLKLEYSDQYQKVFRKVVIPVFYEKKTFIIKKIFTSNFVMSARTGNEEWLNKEISTNLNLENLDLDIIFSND